MNTNPYRFISRPDLELIFGLIPENSRILDLGCGEGTLLKLLRKEKNVDGCGVEISQSKILECVASGVPVVHGDLNSGLREFSDSSFDYVVLSQTLQAVQRPDKLLQSMVRIGKNVLVSFINFGHFKIRYQLLFQGRMPVNETLPTPWYKTQNIHLGTIFDFRQLCLEKQIQIIKEYPIGEKNGLLTSLWPNMFSPTCVFVIRA